MCEAKKIVEELRNKKSRDNRELLDRSADMIEKLAKELCDKSGCHHKCNDTKDCVVEDEAKTIINSEFDINSTDGLINGTSTNTIIADIPRLLLINENKSNNFDVKSNNELFKQALVEGVNNHIDKTIEEEKKSEGEWISNRQTDELICNLCGAIAPVDCEKERFYKSNFCPNCGAKMKGGAE